MPNHSTSPICRKWDNTFQDTRKETQFLIGNWPGHAKRIRITILLTTLAYLGGLHTDFLTLGRSSEFLVMLAARGLVFVMGLICIAISYTKNGRTLVHQGVFFVFLLITATECIEMIYKPELGAQNLPFLAIVVLVYYIFYPSHLTTIAIAGVIGGGACVLVQSFVIDQPMVYVSPTALTFVLVNMLGISFVRAVNRAQRTEYRALAEQRELNGKLQEEIAEREKAERKLLELATIDELTLVFNRRRFLELARREFKRAERTNRTFSLLMIDADNFKAVNDTYGHDVGDLVLQTLAGTCQEHIRELDVLGRMGGEEFAILLPETGRKQARRMAERLRSLIAGSPVPVAGRSNPITVSIGVASTLDSDTDTLEKLFKHADNALYLAKENGRDQVAVWGDDDLASAPTVGNDGYDKKSDSL
jgi:diguanylate cyclase (GGDEF)-like protein